MFAPETQQKVGRIFDVIAIPLVFAVLGIFTWGFCIQAQTVPANVIAVAFGGS